MLFMHLFLISALYIDSPDLKRIIFKRDQDPLKSQVCKF